MKSASVVKAIRTHLNMSQAQMARALKVTPQTINKFERDDANMRFDTLQSMCLALRVLVVVDFGPAQSIEVRAGGTL